MTQMYKRILAAVDGSSESKAAFQKARRLAEREGAELLICHVVDTTSYAGMEHYNTSFVKGLEEYSQNLLNEYKAEAEKDGKLGITTIMEHGSPKSKIPRSIAGKYHVDLIVAGAAGMGAVERFVLGSVSEQITRRAVCDVLIVRADK